MNDAGKLSDQTCSKKPKAISTTDAKGLLKQIVDWKLTGKKLVRTMKFKDYFQTIAFVNAVAWISNQQNHHPDLEVGYDQCKIVYSTHSVGGLSENDFICAAKVNELGMLG